MTDEEKPDEHGWDIREYIETSGHWLDYTIDEELPDQTVPARLSRFMPIEQYLSILTTGELYIPRATEYDDPYDCAFPGSLSDAIREKLVAECDEPQFALSSDLDHSKFVEECEGVLSKQLAARFGEEVADRWFVSCWHAGDTLTDLMWRSYGGHKGVAISCDGQALLQQLQSTMWVKRNWLHDETNHFEFLYGHVNYDDPVFEVDPQEGGPAVIVRHPAFHKNKFFRLDQEFRFAARLTTETTTFYKAGAKLDLAACNASISTSPLCPLWLANSVEAVTEKYYPNIAFKHLSLD